MKLRDIFNNIIKSEVIRLTYNGEFVGLRVSVFNVDSTSFDLYDFDKKYVQDKKLQSWLSTNKSSFKSVALIDHNGMLMTPEEASGSTVVKELQSVQATEDVLKKVYEVFNYNSTHR